jgi:hypothetical protein
MLHSGIDLHKRTVGISTVDPDGHPVRDVQLAARRDSLTRYFDSLTRYFAALPGPHRAVVESTSMWYWPRDLLVGQEVDLKRAHSKHVQAIRDAKVKTDAVDAATLAPARAPPLLRSDLIPEAHMARAEWRPARAPRRATSCARACNSCGSRSGARTPSTAGSRSTT